MFADGWGLVSISLPPQPQKEPSSGDQRSTNEVVELGSSNKGNADPHAACQFPGMRFVSDSISEDDVPIA